MFGKEFGLRDLQPSDFLNMPWTIEQQLKAYAENPRHTERHETLYWSWRQLSRWLSHLLEYSLASFPTYSQHNVTHCLAVLRNIECLLGEDEIRRLSPTDCFAIMLSIYIHDLGMSITSEDREQIIAADEFYDSIEQMESSLDPNLRTAAQALRETDYSFPKTDDPAKIRAEFKKLYGKKLDIYNSIGLLLGEQQRKVHASKSAERIQQWVMDSDEPQSGFSMTGIPIRIFLQIAICAKMHGEAAFNPIMNMLLACDSGFASDKYHPRFIAVLLMLGDILDIDNNRFNPFTKTVTGGNFTYSSEIHYRKHRAIRALHITPKKICIQADCESSQELRQLRTEFDWLENFLRECSYHWAEIAPDEFCGCLPLLEFRNIRLKGMEIPSDLVTSRFQISQKKAFSMLQGANLYEKKLVFLRELLQNAIDAVKQQFWIDLEAQEVDLSPANELITANRLLLLKRYPIHIDFSVVKKRRGVQGELSPVVSEDFMGDQNYFYKDYELGVLVNVQDCGIGIDEEDIRSIIEVGTSHDRERARINNMPDWLRPSGHFGIGLQSVFLVSDTFECLTRTRRGKCFKITFSSGATGDGQIDVIPQNPEHSLNDTIPYGTCFSVFVEKDCLGKMDCPSQIDMDPYDSNAERFEGLHRTIQLMLLMEKYVDERIGEWLFPIILRELPLDQSVSSCAKVDYRLLAHPPLSHVIFTPIPWEKYSVNHRFGLIERKEQSWANWLFDPELSNGHNNLFCVTADNRTAYRLELLNGRFRIWSQHYGCFFCCSPTRILRSIMNHEEDRHEHSKIRVYIKGLYITDVEYFENDLLEYIDVKNDCMQDDIQMSRDGLTKRGEERLQKEIIPKLLQVFSDILRDISDNFCEAIETSKRTIVMDLQEEYNGILQEFSQTQDGGNPNLEAARSYFNTKITSLPTDNFILWDLLFYLSHTLPDQEVQKAGTLKVGEEEKAEFAAMFGNELLTFLDSDESVESIFPFDDPEKVQKGKSRLLQRLNVISNVLSQKNSEDLVLNILNTFMEKLDLLLGKLFSAKIEDWEWHNADIRVKATMLQAHIVIYCMCFYTVNRDGIVESSSCINSSPEICAWRYICNRISDILSYFDSKVAKDDSGNNSSDEIWNLLNDVQCYRDIIFLPGIEENTSGSLVRYSLADVLRNENHFAVFSTRQTSFDPWKHLLVRLSPLHKKYPDIDLDSEATVYEILERDPGSPERCVQRWRLLDEWNDDTIMWIKRNRIKAAANSESSTFYQDLSISDNRYARWMVQKFSSISLGSDKDGNNRLNVLGRKNKESIFISSHMVSLILQRIKEKASAQKIFRLSTPVWDGFAALGCDEIPRTVVPVSRGMMAQANQQRHMMLGVPYFLPEGACFPYDKSSGDVVPKRLVDGGITTLPQLVESLKEVYHNINVENWWIAEPRGIVSLCITVRKFTPLNFRHLFHTDLSESQTKEDIDSPLHQEQPEEESQELTLEQKQWFQEIKWFQLIKERYISNTNEEDRNQTLLDSDQVETSLRDLFSDNLKAHTVKGEKKPCSWRNLSLPLNGREYFFTFLMHMYNIPIDDEELVKAMKGVQLLDEETFNKSTVRLWQALAYCTECAESEYTESFLQEICSWWKEEIWNKDSNKGRFLQYSKEHTSVHNTRELEQLYMAQVRRIICSALSGTKSYLADSADLEGIDNLLNMK